MAYDKALIAGKLRRWETYLNNYRLPFWEDIPDFGLYMEQVISLLRSYLDYLPPELKEEQVVTAAAINNYVRKRVMPVPVKKKYYRIHIAYLIMICTLKQSLSIPTLQTLVPMDLTQEQQEQDSGKTASCASARKNQGNEYKKIYNKDRIEGQMDLGGFL